MLTTNQNQELTPCSPVFNRIGHEIGYETALVAIEMYRVDSVRRPHSPQALPTLQERETLRKQVVAVLLTI